jgi:hypothetical protein
LTVSNCFLGTNAPNNTSAFWCANDWSGTITFNNVIFQASGGYVFRTQGSNSPGVILSFNNCYFVPPPGIAVNTNGYWGLFLIQNAGAPVTINTWINCYQATIVNNQLVLGAAMSQPANTG